MGQWGAADSRGRPLVSEGRFGIRYPWRSTSSCCGGCRCSTMEILMRGVCIFCAYTGANYTLPTSRRVCDSRGSYDIQYSFHLRGGVACQPGAINTSNSTCNITLPLAADSAQAPKTCVSLSRTAGAVALPPDILFYTLSSFSV